MITAGVAIHSAESSTKNIAVTMRTPGHDRELAAGFLFTENIITTPEQINSIQQDDVNNILITLNENTLPLLHNSERNFYTTSSCGVCGKTSINAVKTTAAFTDAVHFTVPVETVYSLQNELRTQQKLFESTGGLHASAVFDVTGTFLFLREDVGRHNALDKLIGTAFLNKQLPLSNSLLLLSGRASFELIQKAAMAGIKFVAAIGAPSTLAVELAIENDITLVGFLRNNTMNIYTGGERIK
jgi:FdhD protein